MKLLLSLFITSEPAFILLEYNKLFKSTGAVHLIFSNTEILFQIGVPPTPTDVEPALTPLTERRREYEQTAGKVDPKEEISPPRTELTL